MRTTIFAIAMLATGAAWAADPTPAPTPDPVALQNQVSGLQKQVADLQSQMQTQAKQGNAIIGALRQQREAAEDEVVKLTVQAADLKSQLDAAKPKEEAPRP